MAVVGSAEFEVRTNKAQLARDLQRDEKELQKSLDRMERDAERRFAKAQRGRSRAARELGEAIGQIGTGANSVDVLASKAPAVLEAITAGGGRASTAMIGLGAGLSAAAAGVLLLAAAWQKGEKSALEFERAATGVGRTAGLTGDQFEALTIAAAKQGEISVKAAREQAIAYLRTGQIGGETISALLELGKDYASFMGVEAAEATRQLAKAMLDPTKAAKEFTLQTGLLTQEQIKQIAALQEAGDLMGAQKLLYSELDRAVEGHAGKLGAIESAWDAIGRSISDAIDGLGRYLYVSEQDRWDKNMAQRVRIERGQAASGQSMDTRTKGIYDRAGRELLAIQTVRSQRKAASDAALANQLAAREAAAQEARNRLNTRIGGGRVSTRAVTDDNEKVLAELAARREILTIEGQIAVLRAQGRSAEAEAAQKRLDVLNLAKTYEAAGFENAQELAQAQVNLITDAEAQQRALNAARERGQQFLQMAVDAQRANAQIDLERVRYQTEIARLEGDPRKIEAMERELYIEERINDLLRDKEGLITAADLAAARAQATREAGALDDAGREGRMRDEFRRSFTEGMRAAIDGDLGDFFDRLADRFTDRMLENMADDLFNLLKGGKENLSVVGSVLGGLKSLIPGFAGGVENFGGGLAYVHKGEVLTNLSAGTSVIPAHAVRAMGASSGAAGGAAGGGYQINVNPSPYFDVQVQKVATPGAVQAGVASYQATEAQRQRAARIAPYTRR